MTAPKTVDPGTALFYPPNAVAVNSSGGDVDLTALFSGGYATEIYVGSSTTNTQAIALVSLRGVAVTFSNVLQGTFIKGCFVTLKQTGTTATLLVARGD
jgi:hypothetical protein